MTKFSDIGMRVPQWVFDSAFGESIRKIAHDMGLNVHFLDSSIPKKKADYFNPLFEFQNGIVWRYFHSTHSNYTLDKTNLLFLDDGFLEQKKFLYIDKFGFGGSSSIVLTEENTKEISPEEQIALHQEIDQRIGLYVGPQKDGPIIVALWTDTEAIHACHEWLPSNVPIIFLRPPSLKGRFQRIINMYLNKHQNWLLDDGSKKVKDAVASARAVVTNLDKPAFLSISRGIPTATLGRGLWSGARCTLECDRKPMLLKTILAYDFDHNMANIYLNSVIKNQIKIDISHEELASNSHVKYWLTKISQKSDSSI